MKVKQWYLGGEEWYTGRVYIGDPAPDNQYCGSCKIKLYYNACSKKLEKVKDKSPDWYVSISGIEPVSLEYVPSCVIRAANKALSDHSDSVPLHEISGKHYAWLEEMGWTGNTTPLEQLALITSEVGEAVQECRGVAPTDKLPSELADIILRTLGMAEELNIDIEKEIVAKMEANRLRGNKGRIK